MVTTHMFVSGSTGSGKTEFLTNLLSSAMAWGSGAVFIDGKGDLSFFAKLHAIATAMGREEDLLLLNFTPSDPSTGMTTHTVNPFAIMTADEIMLVMNSMMPRNAGDAMWTERAVTLMNGIVRALVWLRDEADEALTAGRIREHLSLERLINLKERLQKTPGTSPMVMAELDSYFDTLPGYVADKGVRQDGTARAQHGFLSMQWTRTLSVLCTTFGHIFETETPDVDIRDVVLNRRILVVLLPSLDRSTSDIRSVGSLIVGMVRSMLGQALRTKVEGSWSDVVRKRATNARKPFLIMMDELAQYLTDGTGMMAQQARSLNIGLVFATQDFDSMFHANARETEAIMANTNTKVFMKAENPNSMQIGNVLKTFVDARRFDTQKRDNVLRARNMLTRTEMRYGSRHLEKIVELLALEHEHLQNALGDVQPEFSGLLRSFTAGDMMIAHGGDIEIGRAGYVSLDADHGDEHVISLQRLAKVVGYGKNLVLDRERAAMAERVLARIKSQMPEPASVAGEAFNPKLASADNVLTVWSEFVASGVIGRIKGFDGTTTSYEMRRRALLGTDEAGDLPVKQAGTGRARFSDASAPGYDPAVFDIRSMFTSMREKSK
jgi:hypothetical protein